MVVYKMSGFEKKNVRIPPRLPRWDSNAKRPRGRLQLRCIKQTLTYKKGFYTDKVCTNTDIQTDRLENLPISSSSYENNMLKISH